MSDSLKLSTALPGDDEINGHLEDVPDGMFRETCLRCGFHRYQPESELPDALARIDAQAGPDLFAGDDEPAPVRPDDAPEVWVYGDDDEPAES